MKNEMMKKVEATDNELEAFRIASQMEKEGIEFYKKALSDAKTEKERALFDRLIKEEEQHYSIFANSTLSFPTPETGSLGRTQHC